MRFLLFQLQRLFIFLTDLAVYPFRQFRLLWEDAGRGRSLILGLPSLVIAVVALVSIVVGTSSEDTFANNYEVAKKRAEKEGDWSNATLCANKLVQFQPDNDLAKWELSRILLQDDREELKEANRKKAASIRMSLAPDDAPGLPQAHIWRARETLAIPIRAGTARERQIIARRISDQAEKQIRFALFSEPQNQDALTILAANILVPKKEYDEAFEIYRELFKDYVGYFTAIAEISSLKNDPELAVPFVKEATERYTALLKEDPKNVDYIRRLSRAYAMLREYDRSEEVLKDAIENLDNPEDLKAMNFTLGQVYLSQVLNFSGDAENNPEALKECIDLLEKAYATDPNNPQTAILITRFGFGGLSDSQRALDILDVREQREQAPSAALDIAGTHEVLKGDRLLGIRLLELAIQKNARNHSALNNLAFVIMDSEPKRALDLANQAISVNRRNASYFDTRGNIFMRLGEWAKATKDLEIATRDNKMKQKPALYESLVECYKQQGMISSAAKMQKKVDELKSSSDGSGEANSDEGKQ